MVTQMCQGSLCRLATTFAVHISGTVFITITMLDNAIGTKFSCADSNGKLGTMKLVLSGHSKMGKTKVLKPCGSSMQVESIAECPLGAFCNTFDLH